MNLKRGGGHFKDPIPSNHERRTGEEMNEYARIQTEAGIIADNAWIQDGLDGIHDALANLRRIDASTCLISEVAELYRQQMMRCLPPQ